MLQSLEATVYNTFYVSQFAILPQVNLNCTRPIFIIRGFLLISQGLKFQSLYSPLQSLESPIQSLESPFQSQHWYATKISESRQLSLKDNFLTWPGFELKTAWKKTPLRALTQRFSTARTRPVPGLGGLLTGTWNTFATRILGKFTLNKILFSQLKIFLMQFKQGINLLVILGVKNMLKNINWCDNKLNKKIRPGLPSKN